MPKSQAIRVMQNGEGGGVRVHPRGLYLGCDNSITTLLMSLVMKQLWGNGVQIKELAPGRHPSDHGVGPWNQISVRHCRQYIINKHNKKIQYYQFYILLSAVIYKLFA